MDERHARHEECEIATNISTLAADWSTLLHQMIWRHLLADCVEKLENRGAPKISQM